MVSEVLCTYVLYQPKLFKQNWVAVLAGVGDKSTATWNYLVIHWPHFLVPSFGFVAGTLHDRATGTRQVRAIITSSGLIKSLGEFLTMPTNCTASPRG